MAKQKHTAPAVSASVQVPLYDAKSISDIALKVKAEGFVPAEVLKREFGAEHFTRGIAVLYRDFRMFREVRRPWKDDQDALGYEWADRRFSTSETKKIPATLGFLVEMTTKMAPKYSDFQPVVAHCRYLTGPLGGQPVKDTDGESTNSFARDADGNLVIQRYNLRAMIKPALAMIGKEQALANRIAFKATRIHANGNVTQVSRAVNDNGQGKGFVRSERLDDGTTFTVDALVPTSILSPTEFIRALRMAGDRIGLSPGRSAGFGDFEVVSVQE
jgi:hypothetical protein